MIYDLSKRIDRDKAITRFKNLLENNKKVELKVKHPIRSISQNSYLHLILTAFGLEFGYTLAEVKLRFFKQIVNQDIFYEGESGKLEKIDRWRSTADCDKVELTLAINRFLDYSSQNGYRLPQPEDLIWIEQLQKEVSKTNNKQYV